MNNLQIAIHRISRGLAWCRRQVPVCLPACLSDCLFVCLSGCLSPVSCVLTSTCLSLKVVDFFSGNLKRRQKQTEVKTLMKLKRLSSVHTEANGAVIGRMSNKSEDVLSGLQSRWDIDRLHSH